SPLVICFTSLPSVFIVNRSWLPARELDQTIVPLAFSPTSCISATASAGGVSSAPCGGRPDSDAQAVSAAAQKRARYSKRRNKLIGLVLSRSLSRWSK